MKRKGWLQLAIVMSIAVLIGFTFAVQNYITMNNRGYSITWRDSWAEQVPFWIVWALLSPIVFRITARFPLDRERWWKTILMHIPAGVVFSIVHLAIYFIILAFLRERDVMTIKSLANFLDFLPRLNFGLRLWSYLMLVALGYAMDFYNRYQEGAMRASRLEARLAQAQLEALKMQLHPHFLFNTLNTISALLRKDVEMADKMIARLGDFLRMTLRNSGQQEVAVSEELEFLKCYLEIERIRFQDRLTVEMDIDPQAAMAQVPNLILQPIVETAIRHGISATEASGRLTIRALCHNGLLTLQVVDNGPGLSGNGDEYREGLGLQNTRSRLEQLYGDRQSFRIFNAAEGGVTVEIDLPYHASALELTGGDDERIEET
ncbi:MAG TPA: histidine kinase [Acidobacteriota bacterium]|nr:histidine kinase [Acidobacteriota bacterium]